jgi:glutaredoxin-like protein NrdH
VTARCSSTIIYGLIVRGGEKMELIHVPGKNAGDVVLYALSTCGWCHKTKQLLDSSGVEYSYVYVDLLSKEDKETLMKTVEKFNPNRTFPTLVINNKDCVVGFREPDIRSALKI